MSDSRSYNLHGSDAIIKTSTGRYEDDKTPDFIAAAKRAEHLSTAPAYDDHGEGLPGLSPAHRSQEPLYGMGYLMNVDSLGGPIKDLDVRHHTDYGKVSIASITGTETISSDKANISSLVHESDVGDDETALDMGDVSVLSFPPMGPNDTTTINGVVYNSRGYEVCGQLNQHSKPCQRIGRCPFHGGTPVKKSLSSSSSSSSFASTAAASSTSSSSSSTTTANTTTSLSSSTSPFSSPSYASTSSSSATDSVQFPLQPLSRSQNVPPLSSSSEQSPPPIVQQIFSSHPSAQYFAPQQLQSSSTQAHQPHSLSQTQTQTHTQTHTQTQTQTHTQTQTQTQSHSQSHNQRNHPHTAQSQSQNSGPLHHSRPQVAPNQSQQQNGQQQSVNSSGNINSYSSANSNDRSHVLHPALPPMKKAPYKQGWTKDEHIRFLNGLQIHGKGAWKEIAQIVGSRTPTQIQSHAQKYYLRQKQEVKNKRSIHDLSLEDIVEADHSIVGVPKGVHLGYNRGYPYTSTSAPIAPISQSNSFLPPQNSQDPSSNQLGMLFSSFYRGAPSSSSSGGPSMAANTSSGQSSLPIAADGNSGISGGNTASSLLSGQPYPPPSNAFRTQPPPPMAQPVFSSSSLHSASLLPQLPPSHHNLPPLATSNSLSHAPSTPFPSILYSSWINSTFSSPAGSKMLSIPEFGIDDDESSGVSDGLNIDDLHQTVSSSNSVRSLISMNDDDHPPLTHHHLPHPSHYPHDVDDDKLGQFSSSYMSIPNIPRTDEDSNELPPLTGATRKRHFLDDDVKHDTSVRDIKQFKTSPSQQIAIPLYLNHNSP